jgi:hypothetical protein
MAYIIYCRDFDNLFPTYELYAWDLLDRQTSAIKHHTPGNNPKDYTQ